MFNKQQTSHYLPQSSTLSAFMTKVYSWMTLAILVTALVSAVMVASGAAASLAASMPLFIGLLVFELVVGFIFIFKQSSMEWSSAFVLFLAYAGLNGVTFSAVFTFYSLGTVTVAFFLTAFMFAALSGYGFFTKKDLSDWGTFLFMGLIGLLGAIFIEFFVVSTMYSFIVSCAAVVIFAGLTAYDTQKIKKFNHTNQAALFGAFALYLDFINLFLHLLNILNSGSND